MKFLLLLLMLSANIVFCNNDSLLNKTEFYLSVNRSAFYGFLFTNNFINKTGYGFGAKICVINKSRFNLMYSAEINKTSVYKNEYWGSSASYFNTTFNCLNFSIGIEPRFYFDRKNKGFCILTTISIEKLIQGKYYGNSYTYSRGSAGSSTTSTSGSFEFPNNNIKHSIGIAYKFDYQKFDLTYIFDYNYKLPLFYCTEFSIFYVRFGIGINLKNI